MMDEAANDQSANANAPGGLLSEGPTTNTTTTTTEKKEAQTITASAIATALHSTCFQPVVNSPASTPLRTATSASGVSTSGVSSQQRLQQERNKIAEPPDWSVIPDSASKSSQQSNSQHSQQQYGTPVRTTDHRNSISSQHSNENMFFPTSLNFDNRSYDGHTAGNTNAGSTAGSSNVGNVTAGGYNNDGRRSYDSSPRGGASIATSFSGSHGSVGGSIQGGGGASVQSGVPVPPHLSHGGMSGQQSLSAQSHGSMQQPQLSLSKSGDTINSSQNVQSGHNSGGQGGYGQMQQQQLMGARQQQQSGMQGQGGGSQSADASVLLGLEELERQQADLEKRRAISEAAFARKQQESTPQYSTGLPPLAPVLSGESTHQNLPLPLNLQQQLRGAIECNQDNVPSQIHLEDEETLTSEVTDNRCGSGSGNDSLMKKVNSMEKLGKLRGQMSVSLRRFRSWSLSNTNENPVSSIDSSTQKETLSRSSAAVAASSTNAPPRIIQEPYHLEDGEIMKPIIYGNLHKLGRNGHWQKRFFESNGVSLTYYKNGKRAKVLATLDLCKVGEIAIDPTDPQESTFTIQVSNRPYYLRAQDKTQCNDWVITLNRAREARMNVGNIQLHTPTLLDDPHRSQAGSDEYAPCIVISALRPRTHGSDLPPDLLTCHNEEEQQQIEVMGNWDHGGTVASSAAAANAEVPSPTKAMPSQEPPIMAKWQKKHTAMHTLSMRFLKWARSITKQADACRRETDVVVVPAHVLRSLATQQTAASVSSGPHPPGTSSARRKVSGSDLPVLAEESPMEGRADGQNRSRTSTNSSAGGIIGSQYV